MARWVKALATSPEFSLWYLHGRRWKLMPQVVLWALRAALVEQGSGGIYKDHPGRGFPSESHDSLLAPLSTILKGHLDVIYRTSKKATWWRNERAFCAWHTLAWFTLLSAYSVQTSYFSLDSSCVFPSMFLSRSWGCSCFHPMATMSTRIRGVHESIRMWTNMLTWLGIYDFGNTSSKLSWSEQLRNLHRNSDIFQASLN